MKKGFLLSLVFILAVTINAQQTGSTPLDSKPLSFNVGLTFASPVGDFSDFASAGFGVDATLEYPFNPGLIGTATIGYISYGGEDLDISGVGNFEYSISAIPIYAGGKLFLSEKHDYYALFQVGMHIVSVNTEMKAQGTNVLTEDTETKVKLGLGAGLGYKYAISETLSLDASAKYWYGADDTSYLGIRGGLIFTF